MDRAARESFLITLEPKDDDREVVKLIQFLGDLLDVIVSFFMKKFDKKK
jgi:hypothetical protein